MASFDSFGDWCFETFESLFNWYIAKLPSLNWGVLTVLLMLVGGDIVHRAFASTVSKKKFAAVPFSFGWAAYVFKALTQTRLFPIPELPGTVISPSSGCAQVNHSWTISRLLHVYNREKLHDWDEKKYPMAISIVKTKDEAPPQFGCSGLDKMLDQAIFMLIPGLLHNNWQPMLTLLACNLVSLICTCIWMYNGEKYNARTLRPDEKKTVVLTPGKGWHYAVVVISDGTGFDLDDLAAGRDLGRPEAVEGLKFLLALVYMYLLLKIRAGGGYMFFAALTGFVRNRVVGGRITRPESQGIDLEHIADILPENAAEDTMSVIKKLEEYGNEAAGLCRCKPSLLDGAGIAMISTFFPSGISDEDKEWVKSRKRRYKTLNAMVKDSSEKLG